MQREARRRRRIGAWVPGLLIVCSFIAPTPAQNAAPTMRPVQGAGTGGAMVSGLITASPDKPLSETVVYLEPADPGRTFPAPADVPVVSQRGAKFSPSLVVIAVGQSVSFVNDELRPLEHNVFSRSAAKPFDLGLYKPSAGGRTVLFDQPGVVRLACSIHRYMDGVVFVSPTPFFALAGKDGRYSIEDVPPGRYAVKTWQRSQRYPEQESAVEVAPGARATVDLNMGAGR